MILSEDWVWVVCLDVDVLLPSRMFLYYYSKLIVRFIKIVSLSLIVISHILLPVRKSKE
jgi:hypothetical protein